MYTTIEILEGKTLSSVERNGDEEIIFTLDNGDKYKMYHYQDCCEQVHIDDIVGDLNDLIGSPIVVAEERTNIGENDSYDHYTWTFYTIATIKGYVDIKWYGSSNGYYSESVNFIKL